MKMKRKSLITLIAAGLLLGSAAAMAFGGGHGYHGDGCHHGGAMRALSQLDDVTDEQREQLRSLFKEQRDVMRGQRDTMYENKRAIREAIRSGATIDEIRTLATKQGEQVTAMIMAKAELREKMAKILTAEQMKQLQEYPMDYRDRRENW